MVVLEQSTTVLLASLVGSIEASTAAVPEDHTSLLPPPDSNSLLDIKNELLLAYVQNLVFLIILKLRGSSQGLEDADTLATEVVSQLHKQRIYLERGVRPLEGRLKYQIDKVLRAADDAARKSRLSEKTTKPTTNGAHNAGSDHTDGGSEDEGSDSDASLLDASMARPNLPAASSEAQKASISRIKPTSSSTTAYKPPRIAPTAMPTPASGAATRNRAPRSTLLDEYITTEFSSAPEAQPSIGSSGTILQQGRSSLSSRDRVREKERTEYEESNFTRLPGESKVEKRKRKQREGGMQRDMFGGEDWTGLGGLGEGVRNVVRRDRSDGAGEGVLERREKRRRTREDLPRGDGREGSMGDALEKRRRVLEERMERRSRKSR